MRGTKAKKIRRKVQNSRLNTKTKQYYRVKETGQIVGDKGRSVYQKEKER